MKILIPVQNFDPQIGGAEKSLFTLINKIAEKHGVVVLQPGYSDENIQSGNLFIKKKKLSLLYGILGYSRFFYPEGIRFIYPIYSQGRAWKEIVDEEVRSFQPDIIITQLNYAPAAIDIAKKYGIPSILFLRSFEHFCLIGFEKGVDCSRDCGRCLSWRNKMYYFNWRKWLTWHQSAIENAGVVIANSKFVAGLPEAIYNIDRNIRVLYPAVEITHPMKNPISKNHITMINPNRLKGGDIFLKIAERMPDRSFLAVGRCPREFSISAEKLQNVTHINWTEGVWEYYQKTRVLLIPSRWPEAFGRVAVEAGLFGIPSIATNIGGLPEAVGDGGILIDNLNDIDAWIDAIRTLDRKEIYADYSSRAFDHAFGFDIENSVRQFKAIVDEELGIEL